MNGVSDECADQGAGGRLVEADRGIVLEPPGAVEAGAGGNRSLVDADQRGVELARTAGCRLAGGGQGRGKAPVLGGDERHPLPLPHHDDTGGNALHAARGQPRLDLLPQHRRDFVTEQAVEDAPRFLRIDQPAVDVARRLDGGADRRRGDFVEHHPLHVDPLGRLQHLLQVPGDRLAFAIFVSRQVQHFCFGEQFLELGDLLALVRRHHVERLETVVYVYPEARPWLVLVRFRDIGCVLRQVANVADGGLDHEIGAQVAGYGVRLGGRFDNDEGCWHGKKIRSVQHRVSIRGRESCVESCQEPSPDCLTIATIAAP